MSHQDILKAATRSSTGAWFETQGRIFGKDRSIGLIKPKLNYLQRKIQKVVDKFEDENLPIRIIGLKPRQRGSTTFFCAADYCFLRRHPASAVIIGGEFSQTKEAWSMMSTYAANDRFDWGNSGEINAKEGKWTHGSRLKPETAMDQLAGISGTYQVLHCTEVARWAQFGVANAAEVLTNILKCVPLLPKTMIILESTAEGSAGSFYEKWMGAIDAETFLEGNVALQPGQYVRVFAPWHEFADSAMRLTAEQKRYIEHTIDQEVEYKGEQEMLDLYGRTDEDGIRRLGDSVEDYDAWEQLAWRRYAIKEECKRDVNIFDRDYPHSWKAAFQKSGKMRFNTNGVEMLRKRLGQRVPMHGVIEESRSGLSWRQTELGEAKITIFEKPIVGARYLLSVDVMTGATQVGGKDPDKHAVFALRKGYWGADGKWNKPATAARIVPCRWDIDVLEVQVWRLARYFGSSTGCKIAIEMNMDRGLTELLKQRGADLYQREVFNQREYKTMLAFGYLTTPKTRELLIDTLAKAIREYDTPGEGLDVFGEHAVEQLENFVVKESGKSEADDGYHDDDVLSLALGLELIDQATTYMPQRISHNLPPDLRNALAAGGAPAPGAFS